MSYKNATVQDVPSNSESCDVVENRSPAQVGRLPEKWVVSRIVPIDRWSTKYLEDVLNQLQKAGFSVNSTAKDLLKQVAPNGSRPGETVGATIVTPRSLGFRKCTTTEEFFGAVLRAGLEHFPATVVPRFRLDYRDQPKGEWLHMGILPIVDSLHNRPHVLHIGNSLGGPCLGAGHAEPNDLWPLDTTWIFKISEKDMKIAEVNFT